MNNQILKYRKGKMEMADKATFDPRLECQFHARETGMDL